MLIKWRVLHQVNGEMKEMGLVWESSPEKALTEAVKNFNTVSFKTWLQPVEDPMIGKRDSNSKA